MPHDVIVIGCGAAGLLAAISAGRRGKRVLVLEKNRKLGVKILMSGGTRCNVTHACDARQIIAAFGKQGKFLHSALAAFPPTAILEELASVGVATKREATGKIFPVSDRAIDVRDALVRLAEEAGATLWGGHPVTGLARDGDEFIIQTATESHRTGKLILTTGGQSYPGCGTIGEGYGWAAAWGHSIVTPRPALVPLLGTDEWARELQGVTLPRVAVRVQTRPRADTRPRILATCDNSFLFTHFGYSGPAVMNVSRAVTAVEDPRELKLECDWVPDLPLDDLRQQIVEATRTAGGTQISGWLSRLVPRRMAESLLDVAGIPRQRNFAELSKVERQQILKSLKQTELETSGTLGFKKAEVTAGGVALSEVDSRTMGSKRVPGLYFAGEILDLDGPIGGFNFQAAFSTGFLAGLHV